MNFQIAASWAKAIVAAIAFMSFSSSQSFAEELPSHGAARGLLEFGDLLGAQEVYEDLAAVGDASAQYVVGMMKKEGLGWLEDQDAAADMLRRSVEQGHFHAIRGAVEIGVRSYEDTETTEMIRQAAQSGAAWAQTLLGHNYRLGRSVAQDDKQAVVLYVAAVAQEDADAAFFLASFFEEGRGLPRSDPELALKLLRLAADNGHPVALAKLAERHWNGQGMPRDRTEARRLFRLAAAYGDRRAAIELARQYGEGDGIKADPIEAINWLRLAGSKPEAIMARMKELRMTPASPSDPDREKSLIASTLAKAGRWQGAIAQYRALADEGDADAMFYLGRLHLEGREIARNERIGLDWLQKAAKLNEPRAIGMLGDWMLATAQDGAAAKKAIGLLKHASAYGVNLPAYVLGSAYEHGRGVGQDAIEAVRWFRTATSMKVDYKNAHHETSAKAQYRIGHFFETGTGFKQDYDIAAFEYILAYISMDGVGKWDGLGRALIKDWKIDESRDEAFAGQLAAAQAGDPMGHYLMGRRYETGDFVPRDMSAAQRHYDEAGQRGHSDAQFRLGSMQKDGAVVPRDAARADRLLLLAAEQGHADAAGKLADSYMAGLGVEIDYEKARRWAVFSADLGAASGQTSLGTLHYFGQGLPRNKMEGSVYFA